MDKDGSVLAESLFPESRPPLSPMDGSASFFGKLENPLPHFYCSLSEEEIKSIKDVEVQYFSKLSSGSLPCSNPSLSIDPVVCKGSGSADSIVLPNSVGCVASDSLPPLIDFFL